METIHISDTPTKATENWTIRHPKKDGKRERERWGWRERREREIKKRERMETEKRKREMKKRGRIEREMKRREKMEKEREGQREIEREADVKGGSSISLFKQMRVDGVLSPHPGLLSVLILVKDLCR